MYTGHIVILFAWFVSWLSPRVVSPSSQYPCCNQLHMHHKHCQHFKGFPLSAVCLYGRARSPIFHGCPFQKSQQTCHKKGQQDLNNIKDLHSLFSARLYPPNKTSIYSPLQKYHEVKKLSAAQFYSKPWWLSVLPDFHPDRLLALYCFYFADWLEIYWQRVRHCKQGGNVSKVGAMGI